MVHVNIAGINKVSLAKEKIWHCKLITIVVIVISICDNFKKKYGYHISHTSGSFTTNSTT